MTGSIDGALVQSQGSLYVIPGERTDSVDSFPGRSGSLPQK
jgi:hypothetical protein